MLVPSINNTGFVDTLNWNLLLLKLESKFNISAFWTNIEEYDEDGGIKSFRYKAVSHKIFCVVISDEKVVFPAILFVDKELPILTIPPAIKFV